MSKFCFKNMLFTVNATLVLHGIADGSAVWKMENYRKSVIRNNRVKKISSEPDAVIQRFPNFF